MLIKWAFSFFFFFTKIDLPGCLFCPLRDITFIMAGGSSKKRGGPLNFSTLFRGVTKLWVSIIGGSQNQIFRCCPKHFPATPLLLTIFTMIVLEVREHILSAIVLSTKSVIITGNAVMLCFKSGVYQVWGGHKTSDMLHRGGRKMFHPFDRGVTK